MSPRERINLSLARRVAEGCPAHVHFEDDSLPTAAREKSMGGVAPSNTWGLQNYPLASVYSPIQHWRELYDEDTAIQKGTIFKELDLPFLCGDKKGGNCRGK